jgi:hypothetical protein
VKPIRWVAYCVHEHNLTFGYFWVSQIYCIIAKLLLTPPFALNLPTQQVESLGWAWAPWYKAHWVSPLLSQLEWTSSHQCTSWGWSRWSRFGDEPKPHLPSPNIYIFSRLCSAPKHFSPTYLPPTSYLPTPSYLLPTPSYLPPTSPLLPVIAIARARAGAPESEWERECKSLSFHFQASK